MITRPPRKPHSSASRPELNGARWQKTRAAVRRRDRNMCVSCGATERLSVHHLTPARRGGSDDMENLVTVCARCYARLEAQARRRERVRDEDDLRPRITSRDW